MKTTSRFIFAHFSSSESAVWLALRKTRVSASRLSTGARHMRKYYGAFDARLFGPSFCVYRERYRRVSITLNSVFNYPAICRNVVVSEIHRGRDVIGADLIPFRAMGVCVVFVCFFVWSSLRACCIRCTVSFVYRYGGGMVNFIHSRRLMFINGDVGWDMFIFECCFFFKCSSNLSSSYVICIMFAVGCFCDVIESLYVYVF